MQRLSVQLRPLARRALWRLAPSYARSRAARADAVARLGRLERELKRVGERHEEQIERLEDLARELILAVESLRRSVVKLDGTRAATARSKQQESEQE
jgi:hypothetical protein